MDSKPIDRVLSCPKLPSLPGVALKMLELTRDPNVRLPAIAKTIENDPALVSRVLRTVNSSYYALARPCPTIGKALGLLGLNTVKSLVLGFSLVDSAKKVETNAGFDLTAYWRRSIFGAAGGRLFAITAGCCDSDEAFLGGLIQDIGMLASCAALGEEYAKVAARAGQDHGGLVEMERKAFGFDHGRVGAELAEKWRLPPQLVECIGKHHEPEKAKPEWAGLVRAVCLGGSAATVMSGNDPGPKLSILLAQAQEWFGWDRAKVEELLEQVAEKASEAALLLDTKTGQRPDIAAILAEADEQLMVHQVAVEREASALKRVNEDLAKQTITDALTGAFNRKHFDAELARLFDAATSSAGRMGLLLIDADRFKSVNDTHGHVAGDVVLVELARRLRDEMGRDGAVFRYGGEEFAVLLPGAGMERTGQFAERLRAAAQSRPFELSQADGARGELPMTISVGSAAIEQGTGFTTGESMVRAADDGVYAAKHAGGNRAIPPGGTLGGGLVGAGVVGASEEAAAPSGGVERSGEKVRTVLLVENDPMAARFFALLCSRAAVRVTTAETGSIALKWLAEGRVGTGGRPDLVVCDVRLPDMRGVELVTGMKSVAGLRGVPVVVLGAPGDDSERGACLKAGAALYIRKDEFCQQMGKWLGAISKLWDGQSKAA